MFLLQVSSEREMKTRETDGVREREREREGGRGGEGKGEREGGGGGGRGWGENRQTDRDAGTWKVVFTAAAKRFFIPIFTQLHSSGWFFLFFSGFAQLHLHSVKLSENH